MSGRIESAATQPEPLLVLDYPGRRPEAFIAELELAQRGHRTIDLMAGEPPRATSAAAYARGLLARHEAAAGPARAALAYCATAQITQELARLRDPSGTERLPLILFNARPVTLADLTECYASARKQIRAGAPDAVPPLEVQSLLADPDALSSAVHEDLRRRIVRVLGEEGFSAEEVAKTAEQTASVYTNRLNHLLAAFHTTWPAWGGRVLHVVSADHVWREPWPGAAHTELVEIGCDRTTLLRNEGARNAVLRFLAADAPGRFQQTDTPPDREEDSR